MKILYIHQYFKTPQEGGAIRSYYIAKSMVEAGHEVDMITSHNSNELFVKNVEGIRVHYLPISYDNQYGFFRRVYSFLRFTYLASRYALLLDSDLCYATSTPLTVGWLALKLKRKKRLPYYFEVRDLWPEAPIQLGVIRNKLLVFLSRKLEKRIYHQAIKIICLSPGIENDIKKRHLYLDTIRVPNMSDCQFYLPREKSKKVMLRYDVLESDFVISYTGAIGKVNHLEYLIDAAKACQEKNLPVKFFIAGKGAEKKKLEKLATSLGLKNMFFLGHLNRYEIKDLLNITDASYISFLDNKILESNSPNKFFDALAAGKVVITNTKGWIKDLIDESECGFYANPNDPGDLPIKLLPFIHDRQLTDVYSLNARKLANDHFSRENLTKLIISEINSWQSRSQSTQSSIGL